MGSGRDQVYNIISLLFALLTVIAIVGFAAVLLSPADDAEVAALPTRVLIPTNTPTDTPEPSNTPRPTLPPTFTPTSTFTPSPEPTAIPTETLTPTPTITNTPTITMTPLATDTPTITPEPSPTPGPSPTPPSPFLFRAEISYEQNQFNQAGCEWQGVGGRVVGLDGNPYGVTLQVHVFNSAGIDRVQTTGSNSLYGTQTGYEIRTANTAIGQSLFAQLESVNGVAISDRYEITFPGDCQRNLARVEWIQQRRP